VSIPAVILPEVSSTSERDETFCQIHDFIEDRLSSPLSEIERHEKTVEGCAASPIPWINCEIPHQEEDK
jgi:hypothetical protein